MIRYWDKSHHQVTDTAKRFSDLVPAALAIIAKMPKPVVMVSGPVSSGGAGTVAKNLASLAAAVAKLDSQKVSVFDQTPFEVAIARLRQKWCKTGYCQAVLDEFYLPVLESGLIDKLYLLSGWESSKGAKWEYEQCKRLGIKTVDFD